MAWRKEAQILVRRAVFALQGRTGYMKNKLLTALLGIGLLPSLLFAQLYKMDVDTQDAAQQRVIDRVFTGNTIGLQVSFFEDEVALPVTNWNMRFQYGKGRYDTNGMVPVVGTNGAASNIVIFRSATNAFYSENENYYFSIVGTNSAGEIRTFARGRMIEEYDPATGGGGGYVLPMPWGAFNFVTMNDVISLISTSEIETVVAYGVITNTAYRGDWGAYVSNLAATASATGTAAYALAAGAATNAVDPTARSNAAAAHLLASNALPKTGGTMSGNLEMFTNAIGFTSPNGSNLSFQATSVDYGEEIGQFHWLNGPKMSLRGLRIDTNTTEIANENSFYCVPPGLFFGGVQTYIAGSGFVPLIQGHTNVVINGVAGSNSPDGKTSYHTLPPSGTGSGFPATNNMDAMGFNLTNATTIQATNFHGKTLTISGTTSLGTLSAGTTTLGETAVAGDLTVTGTTYENNHVVINTSTTVYAGVATQWVEDVWSTNFVYQYVYIGTQVVSTNLVQVDTYVMLGGSFTMGSNSTFNATNAAAVLFPFMTWTNGGSLVPTGVWDFTWADVEGIDGTTNILEMSSGGNTNTALALRPDGTGGVEWVEAVSGGVTNLDAATLSGDGKETPLAVHTTIVAGAAAGTTALQTETMFTAADSNHAAYAQSITFPDGTSQETAGIGSISPTNLPADVVYRNASNDWSAAQTFPAGTVVPGYSDSGAINEPLWLDGASTNIALTTNNWWVAVYLATNTTISLPASATNVATTIRLDAIVGTKSVTWGLGFPANHVAGNTNAGAISSWLLMSPPLSTNYTSRRIQ